MKYKYFNHSFYIYIYISLFDYLLRKKKIWLHFYFIQKSFHFQSFDPLISFLDEISLVKSLFLNIYKIYHPETKSIYCLQFYVRLGPESSLDER
jgi:hypothetical protein